MTPAFAPNLKNASIKQYQAIWARWLLFCTSTAESPEEPSLEAYAQFLRGESHQVSCTALRHVYMQLGYEEPPSLKKLEAEGLYVPPAPEEPRTGPPTSDIGDPPRVRLSVRSSPQPVPPEDIVEGEIVKIGTHLYRRSGAGWVGVDALGRATGVVATNPVISRTVRTVFRVPIFEDCLAACLAEQLPQARGHRLTAEEALIEIALACAECDLDTVKTSFAEPTDAAEWLLTHLPGKRDAEAEVASSASARK